MPTDIEIARQATLKPIAEIAAAARHSRRGAEPYGKTRPRSTMRLHQRARPQDGKLILVTAINPTPAGEGKTTTSVGLADALNRIGKKAHAVPARAVARPVLRR